MYTRRIRLVNQCFTSKISAVTMLRRYRYSNKHSHAVFLFIDVMLSVVLTKPGTKQCYYLLIIESNLWNPLCICSDNFHILFTTMIDCILSGIWHMEGPRSLQKVCKSIFGALPGVRGNFFI